MTCKRKIYDQLHESTTRSNHPYATKPNYHDISIPFSVCSESKLETKSYLLFCLYPLCMLPADFFSWFLPRASYLFRTQLVLVDPRLPTHSFPLLFLNHSICISTSTWNQDRLINVCSLYSSLSLYTQFFIIPAALLLNPKIIHSDMKA